MHAKRTFKKKPSSSISSPSDICKSKPWSSWRGQKRCQLAILTLLAEWIWLTSHKLRDWHCLRCQLQKLNAVCLDFIWSTSQAHHRMLLPETRQVWMSIIIHVQCCCSLSVQGVMQVLFSAANQEHRDWCLHDWSKEWPKLPSRLCPWCPFIGTHHWQVWNRTFRKIQNSTGLARRLYVRMRTCEQVCAGISVIKLDDFLTFHLREDVCERSKCLSRLFHWKWLVCHVLGAPQRPLTLIIMRFASGIGAYESKKRACSVNSSVI